MEIFVTLVAIGAAFLVGFFFGLLQSTPDALLNEIENFQILLSTFVAVTTALITWMVARNNLAAARIAKEDDRAHLTNSLRTEIVHRIHCLTRMFAKTHYRLHHAPPAEHATDLDILVKEGTRLSQSCQACLMRAWPLLDQARASDRTVLIELLDALENFSATTAEAIPLAKSAIEQEEVSRAKSVNTMRKAIGGFLNWMREETNEELKVHIVAWIEEAEIMAAKIGHAIKDPEYTKLQKQNPPPPTA